MWLVHFFLSTCLHLHCFLTHLPHSWMVAQTPTYVYETRCSCCSGTGQSRSSSSSSSRHGGRRGSLHTCLMCKGMGYVRRTTARFVPETGGVAGVVEAGDGNGFETLARKQRLPEEERDLIAQQKVGGFVACYEWREIESRGRDRAAWCMVRLGMPCDKAASWLILIGCCGSPSPCSGSKQHKPLPSASCVPSPVPHQLLPKARACPALHPRQGQGQATQQGLGSSSNRSHRTHHQMLCQPLASAAVPVQVAHGAVGALHLWPHRHPQGSKYGRVYLRMCWGLTCLGSNNKVRSIYVVEMTVGWVGPAVLQACVNYLRMLGS